jgi:phosphoribosylformylglycinamidine cyclo-ligase
MAERSTYAAAGVDLDAADEAVRRLAPHARSTFRPEVLSDIGAFAALTRLPGGLREPVLVSATDGAGTKTAVATALGRFDTIGVDVVAMCADDVVCLGAEPLLFLDLITVGRVDPGHVEALVAGLADGCRQAGCALVGGEVAEHPGLMSPGEWDIGGFVVGVVERDAIVDGPRSVRPGDRLLGLPSPGLRCNGYSLARRVLGDDPGQLARPAWPGASVTVGDELLRPSLVYTPAVLALCAAVDVHALAHVTGGGLPGNLARVLPPDADAVVRRGSWPVPPIFDEIRRRGGIAHAEMARVFNLGVGMVAVVPSGDVAEAKVVLGAAGHDAVEIGEVTPGHGLVVLAGPEPLA